MVSVEKVYYPAYVIQDSEGGYKAYLPDFGNDCIASSNNLQETVKGAREALYTCIFKHAQQGNELPKPYTGTPLTTGLLVEIDVWLEPIIDRANTQAVNKNTTAPRWLIRLAEEKGSDFVASAKHYLLAEEKETGVNWQDLFAGRWLEHRSSSDK